VFQSLFGPKNPTKDWQRANDLRLTFDLECGKLNWVGLGERLDRLSFLGPVEDRSGLRQGEHRYFSLGLSVDCRSNDDTVDEFELVQKDEYVPRYRPFPGAVQFHGETLSLVQLTEEFCVRTFGPPYWKDQDDYEIILFYEFPNREWQVELALDGTLNRIIVTRNPIMGDRRQRKAYGVDKS
jgi:hypothetical protein